MYTRVEQGLGVGEEKTGPWVVQRQATWPVCASKARIDASMHPRIRREEETRHGVEKAGQPRSTCQSSDSARGEVGEELGWCKERCPRLVHKQRDGEGGEG